MAKEQLGTYRNFLDRNQLEDTEKTYLLYSNELYELRKELVKPFVIPLGSLTLEQALGALHRGQLINNQSQNLESISA